MKKILFVICLCFFIVGCSSNNAQELDITNASKALDNKLTNMVSMNDNELSVIYGLNLSLFEEYQIKTSQLSNGNFYALIKVNESNKKTVQTMMDEMFETIEKQSSLYTPEVVSLFKNRLATSVGNYLIYLVGNDPNELYDIVKEYIN